jgi:hypothetical protein
MAQRKSRAILGRDHTIQGACVMKGLLAICIPLSLFAGAAMSQTVKSGTDQTSPIVTNQTSPIVSSVGSAGATLSFNNGQSSIIAKCAGTESTHDCVQALLPVLSLGKPYATTSIQCGSTIYQISTGNSSGMCSNLENVGSPGKTTGVTCGDSVGNASSATCDGGCGATTGSGTCTITAK